MPTRHQSLHLPMLLLLAQLLAACTAQTPQPATALPGGVTAAQPPAAPSATGLPTLTPRPGRTPFTMPTQPLYGSKTPTQPPTMPPTVTPPAAQPFTTLELRPMQAQFRAYRRVELSIETDGRAGNPFDPAQVDLVVRFSGPSGQELAAPAFWYQDFVPRALTPLGEPGWRVRFTPSEAGEWSAEAVLGAPGALESVALTSPPLRFTVQPDPAARGFVRASDGDPRYLAFDNGDFYFPIGLNMGWAGQDVLGDYTRWLDHLSQNGGNYIRVWMASWSFALEWNDTGLGNYSQRMRQAWLLDQVFRLAEERGVYVMLCLLNHGAFSTTTNPEWDNNPYNAALGGPLESPEQFVSDPEAKSLFKRRVRYIAARWAYSPNLAVWEWWNEAHWTPIRESDLMAWISEMTAELRKHDPYGHLVSTSYGMGTDNATWSLAEIDLAQQHEYSTHDAMRTLPVTLRLIERYSKDKPVLLAEYGSSAEGESAPFNRGAIHLHNGLWAAPFAGYAGTGMYWWWDNFIEPLNLWYHYRGVAAFFKDEDLRGMKPAEALVRNGGTGEPPAGDTATALAMALRSAERALVWVRASDYTFEGARRAYLAARQRGGAPADWQYDPPAQNGLSVEISGLEDGEYQVLWYSTLEGRVGEPQAVTVTGGVLAVDLPELKTDLAFKVIPAQ